MLYMRGSFWNKVICLDILQTLTYKIIVNNKHNTMEMSKIIIGCSIKFRIPVTVGDHPNRTSHHWCLLPLLILFSAYCISSVSWCTLIRVLCPISHAFCRRFIRSGWWKSCLTDSSQQVLVAVHDTTCYQKQIIVSSYWYRRIKIAIIRNYTHTN